ncbi:Ger(x)C family spore germination protein [Gehongia tenuis]|uniref:Ger(X)C family spore germination protein n=1 Tax=Gehongia tenuis TaxID=2763655 RepID=A0A926D5V0_9FIRM|nr:Ger(x)C family spore germination protein [Gehongia tenuis]MBC8532201.1 Ger(x)C family spore germination protein [Gehongia tenuis]
MKRWIALAVTLILGCVLTGCGSSRILPVRREINEIEMVRALGLDQGSENAGNIRITASIDKLGGTTESETSSKGEGGGGGGGTGNVVVMSREAATVANGMNEMQFGVDYTIFWGHMGFIIFGEDAAREGIAKYIDALARNNELRLNSNVFVAEGISAEELMNKTKESDSVLADQLQALITSAEALSTGAPVDLLGLVNMLDNPSTAGVVPILALEEEDGKPVVVIKGYGVIKDDKLVDTIETPDSYGVAILRNRMNEHIVEVELEDGNRVALELLESACKVRPVFEGEELREIVFEVHFTTNVTEIQSQVEFTEDLLSELAKLQSDQVKGQLEELIGRAQDLKADFLGAGQALEAQHPLRWRKMKDDWNETFGAIPIRVEIESKVNRTYNIREPNGEGR